MTARHWVQIAALTSALGLTCTAVAHDTDQNARSVDSSGVSTYGIEAPSSGAIVTPDDSMSVNPGAANDDMTVNPGPSNDDASSVNPDRDDLSVPSDDTEGRQPQTGSDINPTDMGPGSVRGE